MEEICKMEIYNDKNNKMPIYEELKYWDMGYEMIGGVDEAGRGPLAGPVVAACVILPRGLCIHEIVDSKKGIKDSKKLSPTRREKLYHFIMSQAVAVGVGRVGPHRIDKINILNATHEAMEQAINNCIQQPDCLLIDAIELKSCSIPQFSMIKGDIRSQSIAAASIIAKVTRDHEMIKWSLKYPEYGFKSHKGYGTSMHIENIRNFGLSPIHRKTFCSKFTTNEF